MAKRPYLLVVVDMQYSFESYAGALSGCMREVSQAMQDNAPIIFLEYAHSYDYPGHYGPTVAPLLTLVGAYNRAYRVKKIDDDGSAEVFKTIRAQRLPKSRIKVCGINTDACVKSTVNGLTWYNKDCTVLVIADACNSNYQHEGGLNDMKQLKNGGVNVNIKNWKQM